MANDPDVVVIGAGFAGLYAIHRLRERGIPVHGLEAAEGVGGTWYWNRYPGARCDSESYYYCYAFSSELEQEWDWSERYPGQAEILSYLEHVADRFDLRRDISFSTTVVSAAHDGERWVIDTEDGGRWTCRWLVTAVGCLSSANVPDIPGLESFAGDRHHTGQWPHEGVDVAGRRVGVVGTGSTGIQAIPVLAESAGHLTVFQRTANYSIPARNAPLAPEEAAGYKADYAAIRELQQASTNGHPFVVSDVDTLALPDDERRALLERAWERGGLRFRAAVRDVLTDPAVNEETSDFLRSKIHETVDDAAVAEALTPRDHPFATKRPPIDTEYFETYNRANVSLVDVRADPIALITPQGVRLESGAEHPLDVLVFATGFDALSGPLLRLGHPGHRRAAPRRRVGRGRHHLPRARRRGLPGPLHDHRAGQPVGAHQHADLDRAARRLDRGPRRAPARPRPRGRADARGAGPLGGARARGGRRDAAAAGGQLLVPRRERAGQAPGVPALRRRLRALPRDVRRRGGGRLPGVRAAGAASGRLTSGLRGHAEPGVLAALMASGPR